MKFLSVSALQHAKQAYQLSKDSLNIDTCSVSALIEMDTATSNRVDWLTNTTRVCKIGAKQSHTIRDYIIKASCGYAIGIDASITRP